MSPLQQEAPICVFICYSLSAFAFPAISVSLSLISFDLLTPLKPDKRNSSCLYYLDNVSYNKNFLYCPTLPQLESPIYLLLAVSHNECSHFNYGTDAQSNPSLTLKEKDLIGLLIHSSGAKVLMSNLA